MFEPHRLRRLRKVDWSGIEGKGGVTHVCPRVPVHGVKFLSSSNIQFCGDWAPPAKQHTKNSYSGWSKRATRGYHSDSDDQSRQWEDSKPSDSSKDNEVATEVETGAEVEVVECRDKKHGRTVTDNAVGVTQASSTCDSTTALVTEKNAVRSRLVNSTAC